MIAGTARLKTRKRISIGLASLCVAGPSSFPYVLRAGAISSKGPQLLGLPKINGNAVSIITLVGGDRLTVITSELARAEMNFVRSRLGRIVVVALLPTPAVSSISLGDDTRDLSPATQIVQNADNPSEEAAYDRPSVGVAFPGLSDAPAEVVALDPESADEPIDEESGADFTIQVPARPHDDEPIKPIPVDMGTSPRKVALGRALFHDPRLSKDNTNRLRELPRPWIRRR